MPFLRSIPSHQQKVWFKKGSGTFVRSTLRAVPAKVPDPFLNQAQKNVRRPACKPGSVPRREASDGHFSSRPVARPIEQPTRESITGRTDPALLFGLAPGGVCRASLSPGCWWALTLRDLRPPTFSPLPGQWADSTTPGGILSVALSLSFSVPRNASDGGRYPPPCPVEPGLSSPRLREQRPPGWPANYYLLYQCRHHAIHTFFPKIATMPP